MSGVKNLIRLSEGQAKAAGKVLTQAFYDYPGIQHLFPNLDERSKKLPSVFEYMVRYGIMYGEVYSISENLEGIAVWLPFWDAEMTEERSMKCGMSYRDGIKLPSVFNEDFSKKNEPMAQCEYRCHKQYADFFNWYLYPIGVDPDHQGSGYAGLLLRSKFEEIDKQNIPCYLETHDEQNVPIYQHLGFDVVEVDIIPNTNLPIWAMLEK